MPLLAAQSNSQLESELKLVNNTPEGHRVALEQAKELVGSLQSKLQMSEKDAKLVLLESVKKNAEEDGTTLETVLAKYPAALREFMQYTPDDLRRNQFITVAGTVLQIGLFIASFFLGVLAVFRALRVVAPALPAIIKAIRTGAGLKAAADIAKVLPFAVGSEIAYLGVSMTASAALAWATGAAVNQWNDVFHWGPQQAETQALQLKSLLEREQKQATPSATFGESRPTNVARVTESKTAKPKLFLGTVFGDKVTDTTTFVRHEDDEITSEEDLINDVQINMTRWLVSLPGKLSYEIQIKNGPFDKDGIKKQGTWATLALYITSRAGTRLFIDEILLGPLKPLQYFPESARVKTISFDIPNLVSPANIIASRLTPETLMTVDAQGNVILDVVKGTGAAGVGPVTAPTGAQEVAVQTAPMKSDAISKALADASEALRLAQAAAATQPSTPPSFAAPAAAPVVTPTPAAPVPTSFQTGQAGVPIVKPEPLKPNFGDRLIVVGTGSSGLRIRQGPGTSFTQISGAFDGDVLTFHDGIVNADNITWFQIMFKGIRGWVAAEFLKKA